MHRLCRAGCSCQPAVFKCQLVSLDQLAFQSHHLPSNPCLSFHSICSLGPPLHKPSEKLLSHTPLTSSVTASFAFAKLEAGISFAPVYMLNQSKCLIFAEEFGFKTLFFHMFILLYVTFHSGISLRWLLMKLNVTSIKA